MTKGINYAYQELENAIISRINSAGLPLFAIRDMLNRILLQVDKQMAEQVAAEKKAYLDELKAEQDAKAKAAQAAADEAESAAKKEAENHA